MSLDALTFDVSDIKAAEVMYQALADRGGKVQKVVNKASSKAAQVVKRSAKQQAPVRTGTLKRNIMIKAERSKAKGKKVRQVTFKGGAEANALLQKPIKEPGKLGGKYPKAYYPASIEYGFIARAPGGGIEYKNGEEVSKDISTQKIEGLHFMREGADLVNQQAQDITVDTMMKELEKIWMEQRNA